MKKRFSITLIAALAILAVGCGKKDKAVTDAASGLLSYVPADTPYVFASLSPLPKALRDKLEPISEKTAEMMKDSFDTIATSAEENDASSEKMMKALSVVYDFVNPETLREFGLDDGSTSVLYGNGILPVARLTLVAPDKFAPRFAQMLTDLELESTAEKAGNIAYNRVAINEDVAVLVAQIDDMLVITLAPEGLTDNDVALLLGDTKPAESVADTGALKALGDKYGYLSQGLGFVDFERLLATFIDTPSGLNAALFEIGGGRPWEDFDDTCRAEFKSLAGVMPRMTVGYTAVSADGFEVLPVFELREDIAKALKPVAGRVPGLGSDTDALMKFGIGIDPKGLRSYIEDKVAAVNDAPYQCAQLFGLNMAAMQMVQALQQPVPPLVYNFRGFFFEVDNFDGINFSSPTPPESMDFSLLLAFDNVQGLLQMGQMFVPQLAAMPLEPNGESVQIPQELLTGYKGETFVAMTENLLSIASGKGASANAAALAGASDEAEPLLMAVSVDMAAYMKLMGDLQKEALADIEPLDDEMDTAQAEAVGNILSTNDELMKLYADVFDREGIRLELSDRGVEMPVTLTLQ